MNGKEIVETTADAAFAIDPEGRIIAWNSAAEHHLGYRRGEVLGRCCWRVLRGRDLFSNEYCHRICPVRSMAVRGEPIHGTQMFFRNGSGAMARASMSTVVVRGGVGEEIVHLLHEPSGCEAERVARAQSSPANDANARLSARQIEVLAHLGHGKGTEEIAELLCISSATVRHHVQHILTRLKVHSRLEAVVLARRIGLV